MSKSRNREQQLQDDLEMLATYVQEKEEQAAIEQQKHTKELRRLEALLARKDEELQRLQRAGEDCEDSVGSDENESTASYSQKAEHSEETDELSSYVTELEEILEIMEKENKQLEEEKLSSQDKANKLHKEMQELNQKIEKMEETISEMEIERAELLEIVDQRLPQSPDLFEMKGENNLLNGVLQEASQSKEHQNEENESASKECSGQRLNTDTSEGRDGHDRNIVPQKLQIKDDGADFQKIISDLQEENRKLLKKLEKEQRAKVKAEKEVKKGLDQIQSLENARHKDRAIIDDLKELVKASSRHCKGLSRVGIEGQERKCSKKSNPVRQLLYTRHSQSTNLSSIVPIEDSFSKV